MNNTTKQNPSDDKKPKLNISSEKTSLAFDQKMKDIKKKEVEKETEANAQQAGVPYVNLDAFPISPEALILISEQDAKANNIVCFLNLGAQLRVGSPEPLAKEPQSFLALMRKERPNVHIELYMISSQSYQKAMDLYHFLPKQRKIVRGVDITEEDMKKFEIDFNNFKELEDKMKQVSVTELVTYIISAAIKAGASDIHIEAEETGVKVRYRIDGILQDIAALSRDIWQKLDSRIKLLAGLKINVTKIPQDGRFSIHLSHDRVDVRASVLPPHF